jgi:hypothetical protein
MRILSWFERRALWLRLALKVIALVLIGWVDHVAGEELAFSIFYLVPVATTAWIDGRIAGVAAMSLS